VTNLFLWSAWSHYDTSCL